MKLASNHDKSYLNNYLPYIIFKRVSKSLIYKPFLTLLKAQMHY